MTAKPYATVIDMKYVPRCDQCGGAMRVEKLGRVTIFRCIRSGELHSRVEQPPLSWWETRAGKALLWSLAAVVSVIGVSVLLNFLQ